MSVSNVLQFAPQQIQKSLRFYSDFHPITNIFAGGLRWLFVGGFFSRRSSWVFVVIAENYSFEGC